MIPGPIREIMRNIQAGMIIDLKKTEPVRKTVQAPLDKSSCLPFKGIKAPVLRIISQLMDVLIIR